MKRGKGGANGSGAAAAPAREPQPASGRLDPPLDPVQAQVESDGWFTVSRAAQLLDSPLPRIFDAIRDGRLQVRFEPGRPGEHDKPLVTSAELKQRAAGAATAAGASAPPPAETSARPLPPSPPSPSRAPQGTTSLPPPPAQPAATGVAAMPPARAARAIEAPADDALRRAAMEVAEELVEARATLEEAEQKLDAALKAVYERDVRIARLEAEVAARQKMHEESDGFIRHLETRLDKTEERSEEKEKEIRRLAVGLGEARGEIRLLKPPDAPPPAAWRRHLASALRGGIGVAAGALLGYFAWRLANRGLLLEAGGVAGLGVALAWSIGAITERLRHPR